MFLDKTYSTRGK